MREMTCGELKQLTFIHYGATDFDKEKFNNNFENFLGKPKGGFWMCKNTKSGKNQWTELFDYEPKTKKAVEINAKRAKHEINANINQLFKSYEDRGENAYHQLGVTKSDLKNMNWTKVSEMAKEVNSESKVIQQRITMYENLIKAFSDNPVFEGGSELYDAKVRYSEYVKEFKYYKDTYEILCGISANLQSIQSYDMQKSIERKFTDKVILRVKPGSKILALRTPTDFIETMAKYNTVDIYGYHVIDYNALSKDYDGFFIDDRCHLELRSCIDDKYEKLFESYGLKTDGCPTNAFDVESLVIFNPDVISKENEPVVSYNKPIKNNKK